MQVIKNVKTRISAIFSDETLTRAMLHLEKGTLPMNISHILTSLDECDRTKFCEAIADTLTYLTEALDVLPENVSEIAEVDRLWRFQGWLQGFNGSLEAWVAENPLEDDSEADDDDDDNDDDAETLDFSGIEKAIADEGKEMSINQMLIDQWANEKLVGRGWY